MKINVIPEGRRGVWIAEKKSVIDFLHKYEIEEIHNYMLGRRQAVLGADWEKRAVINKVKNAEKVAILTGDSFLHNMRHALSVIANNTLFMFDIGELRESDLLIGRKK